MSAISLPVFDSVGRFWQDESLEMAMGCLGCQTQPDCGGIRNRTGAFNCIKYCECRDPRKCDIVCPRNPDRLAGREREVRGFGLENVPRVPPVPRVRIPAIVPMLYHSSLRSEPLRADAVAVPLHQLFDFRTGGMTVKNRAALDERFMIQPGTKLVIDGVNQDHLIEPAWGIGRANRLVERLAELCPALITVPNFSMFPDVPRWDNLHSIKRIALLWAEFTDAGVPTSLHVNARTRRDFERWAAFISDRPEVEVLSFEFGTGAGFLERGRWFVRELTRLADRAGRPLDLICRGGRFLDDLGKAFAHVSIIDTTIFMKTVFRWRLDSERTGKWVKTMSLQGAPIDRLFQANCDARSKNAPEVVEATD